MRDYCGWCGEPVPQGEFPAEHSFGVCRDGWEVAQARWDEVRRDFPKVPSDRMPLKPLRPHREPALRG